MRNIKKDIKSIKTKETTIGTINVDENENMDFDIDLDEFDLSEFGIDTESDKKNQDNTDDDFEINIDDLDLSKLKFKYIPTPNLLGVFILTLLKVTQIIQIHFRKFIHFHSRSQKNVKKHITLVYQALPHSQTIRSTNVHN